MATRTMLFSGCCAVREEPAVCAWKRNIRERGLDVGDAVCEGEGDFLDGGGAGFADVITGDGDGVPLGKMVAAPGENVGDDAHGGAHGIDVGAASDVFLQDVVLNGAGK